MTGTEHAVQTGFFALTLWLKCGLAGAVVGAAVAAAQIFPGRWHPAWAPRPAYWFSCPLFTGLAVGVVIALRGVPPLANARTFWLFLCLAIGGITSTAAATAVAFLSRHYDPEVAGKSKRATKRPTMHEVSLLEKWEDKLRTLFRPPPKGDPQAGAAKPGVEAIPGDNLCTAGRKAKLPPERHPLAEVKLRMPHYAGHPRKQQAAQGKLEKPIK